MSYGLLVLRIVVGLILAVHGAQKLFGAFGGRGLRWTGGFLAHIGFRSPSQLAVTVGAAELSGGLLLASGLATPLAALAIAAAMTTTALAIHQRNRSSSAKKGYELPLVTWAAAVALAAIGPGRHSLDAAFGTTHTPSTVWNLGILAASAAAAAATLTLGRGLRPVNLPNHVPDVGEPNNVPGEEATLALSRTPERREQKVEIQVASPSEGCELIDCLWAQGFAATLDESTARWRVEIPTRVDSRLVLMDLVVALETWLCDGGRPGLLLRVGDRRYAMSRHITY